MQRDWAFNCLKYDLIAICGCDQAELKAVKTATVTTEVVDGFEVLHTTSVADTFRLYAAITKRLVVHYPPMLQLPLQIYLKKLLFTPVLKSRIEFQLLVERDADMLDNASARVD